MARSLRGGVVSATTGCLRRGVGVTRGRRPTRHLAPPPSGEPETGGGTAGRVSRAHTREPARRPRRAAQAARAGSGARRQSQAQSPACVRSPKVLSDRRQGRPCQHLSGGKKGPFRAKKITTPGSGAHPRIAGGVPGTSVPPPVPNPSPSTPVPEPSGPPGRPEERGGKVGAGREGRENVGEAASGPGSPSPVRPRGQVPVPPSLSPGEDLVREKEISHSAASDERAPRGTAPGPRPPYPGHPVRLGPVPTPRPGLAVEEGAGQGEKKSRPPTGTHVGTLKGRVRPPLPGPATRASRARSVHVPGPRGTWKHFPREAPPRRPEPTRDRTRVGPCRSLRVTPRGPGRSGPHLWRPTRKNIGQNESDHRDPRAPTTEPVAPSTGLNARARAGPHLRSGALWGPGEGGGGEGVGERTLQRVSQEKARPPIHPQALRRARKTLSLPTAAARPRSGRMAGSVPAAGGARSDAGRPGQAVPQAGSRARRRSHPHRPARPISSDSRRRPRLGATGTVATSVAWLPELCLGPGGRVTALTKVAAEAPETRDNIKAAARWLPTTGSNVPGPDPGRRPATEDAAAPPGRPNARAQPGARRRASGAAPRRPSRS